MAHEHAMYDQDPHFTIDPDTRELKYTSPEKLTIMQGDHNSEIITFDIPRYVDGHDMSLCNHIQVHYINIDATFTSTYLSGIYEVTDKTLSTDKDGNEIIVFSWLVSGNATSYVGPLSFGVRFCCVTDSLIEYSWHTTIYKKAAVSQSINNNDEFVEQHIDTLSEWGSKITSFEEDMGAIGVAIEKIIEIQNSLIYGVDCPHDYVWKPYDDMTNTTTEALEIGICKNSVCSSIVIRNRSFYANFNDGIRNTNTAAQGSQKTELGSYTTCGEVDLSSKYFADNPNKPFALNSDALMNIFGYMGINNGTFSKLLYSVSYKRNGAEYVSEWHEATPTNGRPSAVIDATGDVAAKHWAATQRGNISCTQNQIKDIKAQIDLTSYRNLTVTVEFAVEVDKEYLVPESQNKYITFLRVYNVSVPGGTV